MRIIRNVILMVLSSWFIFACNDNKKNKEEVKDSLSINKDSINKFSLIESKANVLTEEENKEGFKILFNGSDLKGWHCYLKDSISGWKVENGILFGPGKTGADLVSNDDYENFELRFDWKISAKGNSGLIYKVIEDKKFKKTYETGPEYQLIDDENYPAKLKDVQKSGANYDMAAPLKKAVKPAGEWNEGKIIVNQNHIEHWLNGVKVVDYIYGNDDWKKAVAKSKFSKFEYANAHSKGKLAVQDHRDEVYLKNIRIKTL